MSQRIKARELIAQNIERYGFHTYVVSGGPVPRWVYTVGLHTRLGYELVLAGAAPLLKDSALALLRDLATGGAWQTQGTYTDSKRQEFKVAPVSAEWRHELLVGANDYFSKQVDAVQIVPVGELASIDTPDLAVDYVRGNPSAWRWLFEEWPYSNISKDSLVMVDAPFLRGLPASEVARWEEDYWEVFSTDADRVSKDDARLLPLGALLGVDSSLSCLCSLTVGQAIRISRGA